MQISRTELEQLLTQVAQRFVSAEEAAYFAAEQVETHIRKSNRTNVLKEALDDIETWQKHADKKMEIVHEKPGMFKLNFNSLWPSLKLKRIHDTLQQKAQANGIAICSLDNTWGMHTIHLWTQGLAKRWLVALAAVNGGPDAVVPLHGTRGILGTNPFSYALPDGGHGKVIDMATSEIPYFEIVGAKKNNTPLRANAAVDQNGNVTTDASQALDADGVSNLLPMGGNYKGYAFNYLMEIMTASMIGAKLSNQQDPSYVYEDHGGFIIAIDIASFTSLDTFTKNTSELDQVIKSQPAQAGHEIIIPWENNLKRLAETGEILEVEEELVERLRG